MVLLWVNYRFVHKIMVSNAKSMARHLSNLAGMNINTRPIAIRKEED